MAQITTDTLVQSIMGSLRKRENYIATIAKATDGNPVSDAIIKKVRAKLDGLMLTADLDEKRRPHVAAQLNRVITALQVAPQLPAIIADAEALFKDQTRKGNSFIAMGKGIEVAKNGGNDYKAAMEEACPAIEKADAAKQAALAALKTALGKLNELEDNGKKSELVVALTAIINKV